jgi:hypothetical protein
MSQTREALTLDRVLDSVARCLTPEVAQRLLELRADPDLQEGVDELADRCTDGRLTPDERAEYETLVRAGRIIAILQAKARRILTQQTPP